jgi:membrane protein YqaA with SNARE-associated domain
VLAGHAFIEAIILPIPPDVILAPMVLTKPERWWRYALVAMVASVSGGCVSYAVGYLLTPVGAQILAFVGHGANLKEYQQLFAQYGFWVILAKGLTPLPYAIITAASGLAHFSFWQFLLASMLTRGSRFMLSAWLVKRFGPAVQKQIEKNLVLWGSIALVAVIAIVVLVRVLL